MNYNSIASYYDWLGKRVFGNNLSISQCTNIEALLSCRNVLIVGGGTGIVLKEFQRLGYNGRIDYVDISSGMIERASKRNVTMEIKFYQCDIRSLDQSGYDGVHMAFFLDQFNAHQLNEILNVVRSKLADDSTMVVTDFVRAHSWFYRLLVFGMYRFFRIMAGIPARELPPWQKLVLESGWKQTKRKTLYRNRILSAVYSLHKHQ